MKTLHVIVANKIATYSFRGGDIVCGNSDYQIEFSFDNEWDAYETKTVRFIWNGKYVDVTRTKTNIFPVPIVTNTDKLEIGVYAGDLSTTTSALISCRKSIRCNSNVESDGTVVIPEGTPVLIEKTITENGEHLPDDGADGFYKVTVRVAGETTEVIPDGFLKPTGTLPITENGTHDVAKYASVNVAVTSEAPKLCGTEVTPTKDYQNIVPEGDYVGFDEVIVKPIPEEYIIPSLQEKTVTENGEVTADSGYDGLSKVTVNVDTSSGSDSPLPIEVSSEIEMNGLLSSGTVGGVYKYVGEASSTYEYGELYVLEVELISFTIDGTEYQAEDSMTWDEWYESDYNTSSYYISDLESEVPSGYYIEDIQSTDIIIAGSAYTVTFYSHSGGSN